MENVPALLWKGRGMHVVIFKRKMQIGYNAEWTIISAEQFGAPHLRERVFIIAYPNSNRRDSRKHHERQYKNILDQERNSQKNIKQQYKRLGRVGTICETIADLNSIRTQIQTKGNSQASKCLEAQARRGELTGIKGRLNPEFVEWMMGFRKRVDRIKALGNAIVPQCSEYIGRCIWESGNY